MTATPEHVLWAIERGCPFRNTTKWTDPEQTARELRPLRAYSDALAEDRVFEGICIDQPASRPGAESRVMGFPVSEITNMYGDEAFVRETCGGCPANSAKHSVSPLAGCHGWFEVSDLKAAVNRIAGQLRHEFAGEETAFPIARHVRQGFYGLWMRTSWHGRRLSSVVELFAAVIAEAKPNDPRFLEFVSALRRATEHELTMHVQLMPRGRVEGKYWYVAAHCPKCRAEWTLQNDRCSACGSCGGSVPERKRHARRKRPFVPLDQVVGAENLDRFLTRYNNQLAANEKRRI